MNVFEDLIEELKEENLLEETIINIGKPGAAQASGTPLPSAPAILKLETGHDRVAVLEPAPVDSTTGHLESGAGGEVEFNRKRAMEEVSGLQMVEHVLSSVEREHMKMTPASFDDLGVKKALHRFLQSSDIGSDEYNQAEMELMQETLAWFSALSQRDSNISVANIRRFCEDSRPVLSSQALMALARFYRNSPFSEPVRGKFDFVMTRLFSRETGEEQRKQLFGRAEMIGHIRTLYSNWESLDLFTGDDHEERIRAAVGQFDGFINEVERTANFDALIVSDFFNRVRAFKEEAGELFFSCDVTAAAIECNVKVGNRFIELLRAEGSVSDLDSIESRFGYTYDTVISSAASKTLHLLEILKEERVGRVEAPQEVLAQEQPTAAVKTLDFERAPIEESKFSFFSVNKWLALASVLVIALSIGVYLWSENAAASDGDVLEATTVEISDVELKKHVRLARASDEILYAVAQPTWVAQSEDEQKELLRRALAVAQKLNLKRVDILNEKGRSIGHASEEKIELKGP
jgi:hypothetical protein